MFLSRLGFVFVPDNELHADNSSVGRALGRIKEAMGCLGIQLINSTDKDA